MSSIAITVHVVKMVRPVPVMASVKTKAPIITVNVMTAGLARTVAVKIGNEQNYKLTSNQLFYQHV